MGRPSLGASDSKRLQMVITEEELAAIDDWRGRMGILSRSDAIRRLCQIAMLSESVLYEAERSARYFADLAELSREGGRLRKEKILKDVDTHVVEKISRPLDRFLEDAETAHENAEVMREYLTSLTDAIAPLLEPGNIRHATEEFARRMSTSLQEITAGLEGRASRAAARVRESAYSVMTHQQKKEFDAMTANEQDEQIVEFMKMTTARAEELFPDIAARFRALGFGK